MTKKTGWIILGCISAAIFIAMVAVYTLTEDTNRPITSFVPTPVVGIGYEFDDGLGYNSSNPSVMVKEDTKYIFYDINHSKNEDNYSSAVLRTQDLTKENSEYSNYSTVLMHSENGWDSKHIFDVDVVKGLYRYNGKVYDYLMVYCGNNRNDRKNASLGIAFCEKIDGDYVRVFDAPIITSDSFNLGEYVGVSNPSVMSSDKNDGHVTIYYAMTIEKTTYFSLEFDFSNIEESFEINPVEIGDEEYLHNITDIAINENDKLEDKNYKYLSNIYDNNNPIKIEMGVLNTKDINAVIIDNKICIEKKNTATDNLAGYSRIFSACFITDIYGRIIDAKNVYCNVKLTKDESNFADFSVSIIMIRLN